MEPPASNDSSTSRDSSRRRFLMTAIGSCALAPAARVWAQPVTGNSASLTKEQRDRLTPAMVLEAMKKGN